MRPQRPFGWIQWLVSESQLFNRIGEDYSTIDSQAISGLNQQDLNSDLSISEQLIIYFIKF